MSFALDVPHVALLVLPASAPVRRAVYELRSLGVNAHGLDVLQSERGGVYLNNTPGDLDTDPTLLVSTLASTRGIDLPELTHVFLLGIPEDRSADTYAHMAGRVGRFGKKGKVISVVEARKPHKVVAVGKAQGKKVEVKDEAGWLKHMFELLDIRPAKFEHFD